MAGTDKNKHISCKGPSIILVNPQLAENIGTAARAMYNFELDDLRLVKPKVSWPNSKALSSSAGAIERLGDNVKVFKNIEESISDLNYLLSTTVRERKFMSTLVSPKEGIKRLIRARNSGLKVGIIFGPEKAGLTNTHLIKSDVIVKIPTNRSFGSINLAMAVNILSYEWYISSRKLNDQTNLNKLKSIQSRKGDLEYFLARLIKVLYNKGFMSVKEKEKSIISKIRGIFSRNKLSLQEINILHGIISCLDEYEKKNDNNN